MKLLFLKEFITIFGMSFTTHKSNFFWLNLIGPSQKEKLKEAPQNRRFYGKMECLPFGPNI
jgi:hypothetical protein